MHTQAEIAKNFVLIRIVKMFLFALFSFLLVLGNFYFDLVQNSDLNVNVLNLDFEAGVGEKIIENAILRVEDSGGLDLNIVEKYVNDDEYVLEMSDLRYWGNFKFTDSFFNLKYGNIVFIPKNAQFDLILEDGKIDLRVFDGDVYMGILGSEIDYLEYRDEFSSVFLNVLLVPKNTNVKFDSLSVTPKFASLLPDKLQKQMDFYASISSTLKQDVFVLSNLSKDIQIGENLKQSIDRYFLRNSGNFDLSFIENVKHFFKESLAIVPNKRLELEYEKVLDYLDAALYLYAGGMDREAEVYLDEFFEFILDAEVDDEFVFILEEYLYKLSFFDLNEDFGDVYLRFLKSDIFEISIYEILDYYWFNVYESLDIAPSAARNSLREFYSVYKEYYALYSLDESFIAYTENLNILFDNLFLKYSEFYLEEFFVMKSDLEDRVLRYYEDSSLKQEVLQSMLSIKIDFLRRAFSYFKQSKISLSETQKIYDLLLFELKEIMDLSLENDTAVISVFKSQLVTIEDFWGYLNATEYNSSSFYGQTHEERYELYLKERQIIPDITDYFDMGDLVSESLEDKKNEVLSILEDYSLRNVVFVDFDSSDQRFVTIDASLDGYIFRGSYDRYNSTIKNVYAFATNDEEDLVVGENPTSFKNLSVLLELKLADLADDDLSSEEVDDYLMTHAERVARNFVMEKIQSFDFVLDVEQVKQLEDEVNVYRISETHLLDFDDVVLTFDFNLNTETLEDLYMIVDGKPIFLEDAYTLTEIRDLIYAEEDFSILEAELNEEFDLEEKALDEENHESAPELFSDLDELDETVESESEVELVEDLEEGSDEVLNEDTVRRR